MILDVLYAVSWQRFRNVAVLLDGGPGSGIHKSEDGGNTWRELTSGLPSGNKGKIGFAISPQRPDVVYATIELANKSGGLWRSEDGGESWEKRGDYLSGGTGPHYYQEIFASLNAFDRIYQMDVHLHRSDDGGKTFERMQADTKHVDHHAMAFREGDPNYLLVGNDGGLYESFDGGETWKYVANLPITQFYKVTVDYAEPFYNIYAGAQDNSSIGGPSRTNNVVGIRNEDWFRPPAPTATSPSPIRRTRTSSTPRGSRAALRATTRRRARWYSSSRRQAPTSHGSASTGTRRS